MAPCRSPEYWSIGVVYSVRIRIDDAYRLIPGGGDRGTVVANRTA